ncbi:MAG: AAA family ATPase [Chloroflexi bacterium]|nr:AAA family ATPase [Chloroflexota bacterium]
MPYNSLHMPPIDAGPSAELQASDLLDRMRSALGSLPRAVAHPVLVILSGLPATGKSTLARLLADRLPACIVASDAQRRILFPQPAYTPEESRLVFDLSHRLTAELLSRCRNVIFDATNLRERYRDDLYQIASATGSRPLLVRLIASGAVVATRLAHRASGSREGHPGPSNVDDSEADWLVYQRMRAEEEPIRRPHVTVDSSTGLDEGLRKVLRALATTRRWQE